MHYGQEIFEGLKAYRRKDGGINLFRPDQNAKRMANSAKRLLMEPYPEDEFIKAVKEVVLANQDFVPPYGSSGTLYLRPFMIGTQPIVGVSPSETYQFRIYATPVGAYIRGLKPMPYEVSDYDRAAPVGTGQAKTASNYASSLLPSLIAKKNGFADALYLDPKEHKYIDEFGGANRFAEAGAMGTATVISTVGSLTDKGKKHVFGNGKDAGPITQKLYDTLTGIQFGDLEDKYGWIIKSS